MSLDVYLVMKGFPRNREGSGIFVRENGQNREISRAEWNEKFPDREPVILEKQYESDTVYEANITHNLGYMANEAGIYEYLWRPDEIGVTKAEQLIEPLKSGLANLKGNREYFEGFNPSNGWGTYEGLVNFVTAYLDACIRYPLAEIKVSR